MRSDCQIGVQPTDSIHAHVPHAAMPIRLPRRPYDLFAQLAFYASLAASPDVVELQIKHFEIERKLQSIWAMADQRDALQDAQSCAHTKLPQIHASMQGQMQLMNLLHASFEAEPLEDGIDHPAEDIVSDAIRSAEDDRVFDWLNRVCLDLEYPTFSASILRCLGRHVRPGTESWRTDLVRRALRMNDVEIRDAALQAAEFWGGVGIRNVLELKVRSEPLQWLRSYMQDVIEDLGEQECSWRG